jgi:hypothetical protein
VRKIALALVAGLLFAVGLGVSGMTQPSNVIAFLDVAGRWNPSLALVMGAAIAVHFTALRFILAWNARAAAPAPGGRPRGRARAPIFAEELHLPTRRDLDARLVVGSTLFGVGWGLAGYCPGPALVGLGTGAPEVITFAAAMIGGMLLEQLASRSARSPSAGRLAAPTR